MPTRKILAFFMHEYEEQACLDIIKSARRTESYIIGEVDDAQLEELKKKNILVQTLDDEAEPEMKISRLETKKQRRYKNIHKPAFESLEAEENAAGFPAFYKFTVEGPMLEEYKLQLQSHDLKVLEFLPPSTY